MNSEVIKMEVNIAGERISLTVPFSRQEAVRNTEAELMDLYRAYGEKFPKKSPKQLLAMLAYKFASSYYDLAEARNEDMLMAQDLLEDADRVCCGQTLVKDEDSNEFPLY